MAEMSKQEFINFRKRVDKNSHWEQFAKFFLNLKKHKIIYYSIRTLI